MSSLGGTGVPWNFTHDKLLLRSTGKSLRIYVSTSFAVFGLIPLYRKTGAVVSHSMALTFGAGRTTLEK